MSGTSLGRAGVEPDVLLECSGNARATWDAVSVTARAGTVVLVGWAVTTGGMSAARAERLRKPRRPA